MVPDNVRKNLVRIWSITYTLTLGQCTQTLLKEDSGDWEDIVAKYDSIRLLNLIEKYVLKQTESHYPYLAVQEEM